AQAAVVVRPAVAIPRMETQVTIDGKLSEAAWQQAALLTDFHQSQPVDGRAAEEKTEVRVWYAPDAIHFGVIAHDRMADVVRATQADRDNIGGEDHVIIYLDTFNDRRRAFFFAVNALGVQADGVRTEGANNAGRMFGGNTDYNPDYIFESRGERTSTGYVVEVRIPFKSLRYPTDGPQSWGLQIERITQRTGYTDTWTDVRRANASFLLQSGTVEGLRDLRRGLVWEAQPFFTTAANGTRNLATSEFERADPQPEAGVNLKLSVTQAALDATVNPDFSQVESDAGQVTVNERFALFFPEKRPFFLEGIELFNAPNQLVYTRQVVDPIAGGKLTAKLGRLGVAHLTALDEDAESLVDAEGRPAGTRNGLFNITRVRTDFGSNSTVGMLLSDRSVLDDDNYNRVVAGDVRYVFGRMYFAEVQLGNAWTRDVRGTRAGPIWKIEADRTGRSWGFNYELSGVADEFVTRAGFVPRSGAVDGHLFNRLSFYGAAGARVESVTTFFGPTRLWHYDDFGRADAAEGDESVTLMMRLRGGWNLQANARRRFFHFDPSEYSYTVMTASGPQVYRPLDRVAGPSFQVQASTPIYRRFNASVTINRAQSPLFAEGSEGHGWSTSGDLSVRPTAQLRIGWSNGFETLNRARTDGEFARSLLSRIKTEYQSTRALFFRVVADYRAERMAALEDARSGAPLLRAGEPVPAADTRSLRIDLLTSYEPSPGTVAFLGYGANLLDDPQTRSWQRQSDGFFVKLAYQFRR
ncbi:MAG: DUF5916 domain-containing protein, partial [Longimicrobiales bacterium]